MPADERYRRKPIIEGLDELHDLEDDLDVALSTIENPVELDEKLGELHQRAIALNIGEQFLDLVDNLRKDNL